MAREGEPGPIPASDGNESAVTRSTGELFAQLTEQISHLFREELRLAEIEMREKAKSLGTGAALFGAAGSVAYLGAGALAATAIIALNLVLPAWSAALIVTVVLFAIAAVLALLGRRRTKAGSPPTPSSAMQGLRRDVGVLRKGMNDGR